MAKQDEQTDPPGMSPADLKRLLRRAQSKPIHAAVGQGDAKSGGLGLLLLDPVVPPKALLKTLKEQDPAASKLCFGTVSVDKSIDPKLVALTLNRRQPGLARKLRHALKGTGYSKVTIETKT